MLLFRRARRCSLPQSDKDADGDARLFARNLYFEKEDFSTFIRQLTSTLEISGAYYTEPVLTSFHSTLTRTIRVQVQSTYIVLHRHSDCPTRE